MSTTESWITLDRDTKEIFLITQNDGPVALRKGLETEEKIVYSISELRDNPRLFSEVMNLLLKDSPELLYDYVVHDVACAMRKAGHRDVADKVNATRTYRRGEKK